MFEVFRSQFRMLPEGQHPEPPPAYGRVVEVVGYQDLMASAAGCSFENGLYRLHAASTAAIGQRAAGAAFPEYGGRLAVFGFDWLGRQFALDFGRIKDGEPLVMMLEPGTGEALEIPVDFVGFHDVELVNYRDAALASELFSQWAAAEPRALPLRQSDCVGYRVPLFLGGRDEVTNLEVTDFEVYWSLVGQMRARTKDLPAGTIVRGISVEDL